MNGSGSIGLAFLNADLFDVETINSSVIYGATVCTGTCTPLFLGVTLSAPSAVVGDANFLYVADSNHVWRYDPVLNTFTNLADAGLLNGVTTPFNAITALALDSSNHVFAGDTSVLWQITNGPLITAVTPRSATPGSSVPVTITGTGLTGGTLNMPTGITASSVTVVDSNHITATFAVDATAPLSTPIFTVTTPTGTSNPLSFAIVSQPPKITSITPATGAQGTSVAVTIAGLNLVGATLNMPPGITASAVTVDSAGSQITGNFAIAADAPLGPQSISATNSGGTTGILKFTVNPPPPTIASISPASGALGTNVAVTLAGTNLAGATLNVPAGITATAVTATASQITATFGIAATAALGPASIGVKTAGGNATVAFTVNPPPPVLTAIAPNSGSQGDNVSVTLTGTNLTGASLKGNLASGITAASVTVVSDTQITATFAIALTATLGAQPITVTTASGTSNPVSFTVKLPPPPTLSSIAPGSAAQGATLTVTLAGTNLIGVTAINAGPGITVSNLVSVSTTQMNATFAIGAAAVTGPQNVTITTPSGTGGGATFTINPGSPTVTSITPSSGQAGSTQGVKILGTNLTGATVSISGPGITVTNVKLANPTEIDANFVIAAGTATGPQTVSVTSADGTATATSTFTVQ
jgi:hypothetical protein